MEKALPRGTACRTRLLRSIEGIGFETLCFYLLEALRQVRMLPVVLARSCPVLPPFLSSEFVGLKKAVVAFEDHKNGIVGEPFVGHMRYG